MCTLATDAGHAFIDTALYLPESWTSDASRLTEAGVPQEVAFATKPELSAAMLSAALTGGVRAGWVAADEVYGDNTAFREAITSQGPGYVLAVSCDHQVALPEGKTRADHIATTLPAKAWQRLSAGAGSKGERLYDWAIIELGQQKKQDGSSGHHQTLLIRRNIGNGELAYYRCAAPSPVTIHVLVKIAGMRWRVEENIQAGKGCAGLDEHQVRTWTSWRRWAILAILAHAFLAVAAARERHRAQTEQNLPTGPSAHITAEPAEPNTESGDITDIAVHTTHHQTGLIPLTCNEIRHIKAQLARTGHNLRHITRWHLFRRRHQHRSRRCHYRRREEHQDHELRL